MEIRVNEIYLKLDYKESHILFAVQKRLGLKKEEILSWKISKKSVDARKKFDIQYVFSVDVKVSDRYILKDKKSNIIVTKDYQIKKYKELSKRPVVVGFGPAGIFASLVLAESGLRPIVIERGSDVENRQIQTKNFFKNKVLNTESNVQFGEGGAGTFSDGKLNTGIKSPYIKKVLEEFVSAGAPAEIMYDSKPHIGTDKLPNTVKNIREKIKSLGADIFFDTKMTDLVVKDDKVTAVKVVCGNEEKVFETDNVILAIGHSARDSFKMLDSKNIAMEQKPFSVGVRIEHHATTINKAQYGQFHDKLPTADYKLSAHLINGKGVYTFCMCPGGVVVPATSEENAVVTNGMSEYKRDAKNSNSGVLVSVSNEDFKSDDLFAGMKFQEKLERKAFIMAGSNYNAPAQRFEDFLKKRNSRRFGDIKPSYEIGTSFCDLNKLFPENISKSIAMGINAFGNRLAGFNHMDAVLTAPETRSSSPIRIIRNEKYTSISTQGLYLCGEGAGYAGGITSAAVDGISCAKAILNSI